MEQSLKEELKELQEYHSQLQEIHRLQQNPGWAKFSQLILSYTINNNNFGNVALLAYPSNEDPRNIALKNELFRFYKDGLLRSLTLVQEELNKTERQINEILLELKSIQEAEDND